MYIAIIGDIINSKALENRLETQTKLEACLETINREYGSTIASRFVITLGDEFQGLCQPMSTILELIDKIKFTMYPVQIRFGIGIGGILTEINPEMSIGSDGPAFWKAREAILIAHDETEINTSRTVMLFEEKEEREALINDGLKACDFIESRWRASQYELVKYCVTTTGHSLKINQREIAKALSISSQATNQRVKSSGLNTYVTMKQTIGKTITKEQ